MWVMLAVALAGALAGMYLLGEWRGSKHYYEPIPVAVRHSPTDGEPSLPELDRANQELADAITGSITVITVLPPEEVLALEEHVHQLTEEAFMRDLEEELHNGQG